LYKASATTPSKGASATNKTALLRHNLDKHSLFENLVELLERRVESTTWQQSQAGWQPGGGSDGQLLPEIFKNSSKISSKSFLVVQIAIISPQKLSTGCDPDHRQLHGLYDPASI